MPNECPLIVDKYVYKTYIKLSAILYTLQRITMYVYQIQENDITS